MLNERPQLYQQCVNRVLGFLWYRRLITTERGYLGNAPALAQSGDFIAILWGCPAPLVLRRCLHGDGDTFEIISECYVEGIMEGEVARAIDDGSHDVQAILIS